MSALGARFAQPARAVRLRVAGQDGDPQRHDPSRSRPRLPAAARALGGASRSGLGAALDAAILRALGCVQQVAATGIDQEGVGQGAAANQHAKDHPSAIDQAELDLSFDRADADLHGDEDALLRLPARRSNLTAPSDARLDRHPAIALAPAEAHVEAHSPRRRARGCSRRATRCCARRCRSSRADAGFATRGCRRIRSRR